MRLGVELEEVDGRGSLWSQLVHLLASSYLFWCVDHARCRHVIKMSVSISLSVGLLWSKHVSFVQVLKERGVDEAIIVGVADKRPVDRSVVSIFITTKSAACTNLHSNSLAFTGNNTIFATHSLWKLSHNARRSQYRLWREPLLRFGVLHLVSHCSDRCA